MDESVTLISDILEFCKQENIEAYLKTAELKKSVSHNFSFLLEKQGFGKYFIDLVKFY